MRSTWPAVLAAVILGAAFKPAQATCFLVFDRNDNLIYRSQQAPVDMSDPNDRAAAAARDAMRARGEYMMYVETDQCAPLTMMLAPGTSGALTIDAIIAGIPSMSSPQGVPFDSATPGQGIAPSTRVVGASRGGVGVMRATPGPGYK
jgi:hypothetical protein